MRVAQGAGGNSTKPPLPTSRIVYRSTGRRSQLSRSIRMLALTGAAAALIAPANAAAFAIATPPSLDFGSVPVGTTSAPQTVSLLQSCTVFDSTITPLCLTAATDLFSLSPAASGD